jgi:hypothetical protein
MAQNYPTLFMAVPAYNYLIDALEDLTESVDGNLQIAVEAAVEKLKKYYKWTDSSVYTLGTSAFFFFLLLCFYFKW